MLSRIVCPSSLSSSGMAKLYLSALMHASIRRGARVSLGVNASARSAQGMHEGAWAQVRAGAHCVTL
eukprot:9828275-Alexandrium_andersonii.AAC.1